MFPRQPKPSYWAGKERKWVRKLREWAAAGGPRPSAKKDALWSWQHQNMTLIERFHLEVRPLGAPSLCAYCDGPLEETSASTLDHFLPEALCPKLGVFWENLFPACTYCNSSCKKNEWSADLLRPDRDDVESFFDFDPLSGKLSPKVELESEQRRKAEVTIRILGLNEGGRPQARRRRWKDLENAWTVVDEGSLRESIEQGPYRFVAELLRDAKLAG